MASKVMSKNNILIMFFAAVILIMVCCEATSPRLNEDDDDEMMAKRHEQWMAQYGRVYGDETEKAKRFNIFKENVLYIEFFNSGPPQGEKPSFTLGINEFADLTNHEFRTNRNGYINDKPSSGAGKTTPFRYENVTHVPDAVDWRKEGAVTPVKSQGRCGCCWAFSAVAAMEGIVKLSGSELISLSEQELVDCDTAGRNHGCEGGQMDVAFEYIIKNKGLTTESNYPFKGTDDSCNRKLATITAAKISGYEDVPANSEAALLKAAAHQPVSVAIDAGGANFQFYSSGIYTGSCGTELDHGVTVVGYGASDDGTKYWEVKNSWGESWGEEGYFRLERDIDDEEGLCGIAMQPSYPTTH